MTQEELKKHYSKIIADWKIVVCPDCNTVTVENGQPCCPKK